MSEPRGAPLSPRWLRLLLLPVTLLVFGGLALLSIQPPSPIPADSPPGEFSAIRAMEHLGWIAAEPHPMGSKAHTRVRERLVRELEALGLEVTLQRTSMVYDYARRPTVTRMAWVTNVLARKPGTRGSGRGSGKALALMAHYDSVPGAPGAADDGSGMIAILETLRALADHPPLDNDLLVVITDGEERGLLGAQAFVREHPWAQDIGLAFNFEARGTRGPVFLFETSEGNAPWIREVARAAPEPFANSLSYALYRRLPNDTDLSILKAGGIPGLNFAFNQGFYNYHTAMDRPDRLSPASVQHMGSYALALTRHFGDLDLDALAGRVSPGEGSTPPVDATYFNTVGFHLIHYPMAWAPWLTALALLALGAVLGLAVWTGAVRPWGLLRGLLRGFLAFVVQVAASSIGVLVFAALLRWSAGSPGTRSEALLAHETLLLLGYGLWLVAVALWVWHRAAHPARRSVPIVPLSLGALCGWAVLLVLVTWVLPGAAYLLTWPLLAALVAHGVVLLRTGTRGRHPEIIPEALPVTPPEIPSGSLSILTAGAIPGVLWLIPYTVLFFFTLGVAQPALALTPAMWLAGLLVPSIVTLENTSRRLASGACLAAGLGLLVCVAGVAPFDKEHPKPVELLVWHDADSGHVQWASPETVLDEWTGDVLGDEPEKRSLGVLLPGAEGVLWTAPAPAGSLWLPRLEPVDREASEQDETPDEHEPRDTATHRFRLRVPQGSEAVALSLPADAGIRAAWFDGKPVKVQEPDDDWWRWWIFDLPPEGAVIGLDLGNPEARLEVRVASFAYRWPDPLAPRLAERPPDRMARARGLGDSTVVTRTFELGPEG